VILPCSSPLIELPHRWQPRIHGLDGAGFHFCNGGHPGTSVFGVVMIIFLVMAM